MVSPTPSPQSRLARVQESSPLHMSSVPESDMGGHVGGTLDSDRMPPAVQRTPGELLDPNRRLGNAPSSSPLRFPDSSSSPQKLPSSTGLTPAAARIGVNGGGRQGGDRSQNERGANGTSSPLFFPSTSSPAKGPTEGVTPRVNEARTRLTQGTDPLFLRSATSSPTLAARRGDIHSTTPLPRRGQYGRSEVIRSENDPLSAMTLSAHAQSDLMSDAAETERVIWGTNVQITESMSAFRDFLRGFKRKYRKALDQSLGLRVELDAGTSEDRALDEELVYERLMLQMRVLHQVNMSLDAQNLLAYPPTKKLYTQLQNYPQEVIPIMDQVLKDTMIDLAEETRQGGLATNATLGLGSIDITEDISQMEKSIYKVRPFNLGTVVNLRGLNPSDIDKLVCIHGLAIRASAVIPDMKTAFFRCLVCNHTVTVQLDRGRIEEPTRCPRQACGQLNCMSLIHNRSDFADKQIVRLQETPDSIPDGQTPHTVSLCVYDEIVDVAKAGDRIEVTGIFRSTPVRINPRQRTIKSLYRTYVDVVHIKRNSKTSLSTDASIDALTGEIGVEHDELLSTGEVNVSNPEENKLTARVSAEDEEKIIDLSKRPDLYDLLSRSLAPSIYEMDDVKKGILLQLFGGTNKTITRGGAPRYRGDINILMVGDPGTSKSQILQYVHKIAPRGVYASGKGSSAVGLTAYITRDPDTKQLVLESGALVLSDGGVCCIDEFDKMSDATRSVLHEVMEQQTVSIAKAGIITTLNARSSILAAANPVGSRYNPNLPITRNIDLPPTLISRFDLVYLVLDKIDEVNDRRLGTHLVNMYNEDKPETGGYDILPVEMLTRYISYARANIHPVISEAASQALVDNYVSLRKVGEDPRTNERRITATTRQLESMIRLAEAHAKMRLSAEVTRHDVDEALRLIREALKESATDPITGLLDLDLVTVGQSTHGRKVRGDLKREILTLLEGLDERGKGIRWTEVAKAMDSQSSVPVETSDFNEAIKGLESEGTIKVMGEGPRRIIRRIVA